MTLGSCLLVGKHYYSTPNEHASKQAMSGKTVKQIGSYQTQNCGVGYHMKRRDRLLSGWQTNQQHVLKHLLQHVPLKLGNANTVNVRLLK